MKVIDRVWINCERMWKWISENLPDGFFDASFVMKKFVIETLKRTWLKKNGFTKQIPENCFFCDYNDNHGNPNGCDSCPARAVEKTFHCTDERHCWCIDPIEFYRRMLKLNKRRIRKGN